MGINGYFCGIDEFSLGIFLSYGVDELGDGIHITQLGFGIFVLEFILYLKE